MYIMAFCFVCDKISMTCSILMNDLSMFLKSRTWINVDFKRNLNLCCEFHSPRVRGRVKGCCQTEVAMSSLRERQRTSKIKYVPALLKHRTFKG